jgi:hypothetical protein
MGSVPDWDHMRAVGDLQQSWQRGYRQGNVFVSVVDSLCWVEDVDDDQHVAPDYLGLKAVANQREGSPCWRPLVLAV